MDKSQVYLKFLFVWDSPSIDHDLQSLMIRMLYGSGNVEMIILYKVVDG